MRVAGLILMATLVFASIGRPRSEVAAGRLAAPDSGAPDAPVACIPGHAPALAPAAPIPGRGVHESALETEETDTDAAIAASPACPGLGDPSQAVRTAPASPHPDPHRPSRRPLRC